MAGRPRAVAPATYGFVLLRMIVPLWFVLAPLGLALAVFELPWRLRRRASQPPEPCFERISLAPTGRASGATMLCVHGWPDHAAMWTEFAERQAERGYQVEALELPGFGTSAVDRGYDFDAMIDALHREALALAAKGPVVLAVHDWGCVYGLGVVQRDPELFARVIVLDVGRMVPRSGPGGLGTVTYQCYLALANVLGGRAGTFMARQFLRASQYPGRPLRETFAHMGYPYRFTVARVLSGTADALFGPLPNHPPLLFVFGKNKPWMFHGETFLEQLRADPRSDVVGLDCGHWILSEALDEACSAVERWDR